MKTHRANRRCEFQSACERTHHEHIMHESQISSYETFSLCFPQDAHGIRKSENTLIIAKMEIKFTNFEDHYHLNFNIKTEKQVISYILVHYWHKYTKQK